MHAGNPARDPRTRFGLEGTAAEDAETGYTTGRSCVKCADESAMQRTGSAPNHDTRCNGSSAEPRHKDGGRKDGAGDGTEQRSSLHLVVAASAHLSHIICGDFSDLSLHLHREGRSPDACRKLPAISSP